MTMQHKEIEALMLFVDPDTQNAIGAAKANPSDFSRHFAAFGPRLAPDPAIMNLLVAAPMLYQTLSQQYMALQVLVDMTEAVEPQTDDLKKLARSLLEMQNACLLAQRVAQVGIDDVAKTLDTPSNLS